LTTQSLSFDVGKDGVIVFKFPNKFYINLLKGAIYAGEIFIFSVFTRDAEGENTPNHCKYRWFRGCKVTQVNAILVQVPCQQEGKRVPMTG
jgi:hypothetical protein